MVAHDFDGRVGKFGRSITAGICLRSIVSGALSCLALSPGVKHRTGDVDLLLVQETDKRFLERYDGLLREITQAVSGHDVDLLIYTPQELAQLAHRPFYRRRPPRRHDTLYESQQESPSG